MIIIALITDNGVKRPERSLTKNELKTVIETVFNGENVTYYQQGDEVPILD
jgi:hypothetical protein